jgi:anti-sigma factor RsiW
MEQLSEYLDQNVRDELRKAVDEHLHTCKHCSYYVDTVRKTVVLYQADRRIEVPIDDVTVAISLPADEVFGELTSPGDATTPPAGPVRSGSCSRSWGTSWPTR